MEKSQFRDMSTVAFFLLYLEKEKHNAMYGSHHINDVIDAFARLCKIKSSVFRGMMNELERDR